MKMSNDKKKEIYLENFEIIKDNYDENASSLRDVVVMMFPLDKDVAVEMWKYLLKKYKNQLKTDSEDLVSCIIGGGYKLIGRDAMNQIICDDSLIKQSVFSDSCYVRTEPCLCFSLGATGGYASYVEAGDIIKYKIETNDLAVANELLDLVYHNPNKKNSWYEVLDRLMPAKGITEEAYDLLEMWCEKVETESERAKLRIKMMAYIE